MTCEEAHRSDYETQLADYIDDGLTPHGWFGAYIKHVTQPMFRAPGMVYLGASEEDFQTLEIFVGAFDGTPVPSQTFENAVLLETRWTERGARVDEYDMGDGTRAIRIHLKAGERFPLAVPYFAIRLEDWPLTRSVEEDFGPRFVQALGLLLEVCIEARERAFELDRRVKELDVASCVASRRNTEAAERLEPDPQPRNDNLRGKEAVDDIFTA